MHLILQKVATWFYSIIRLKSKSVLLCSVRKSVNTGEYSARSHKNEVSLLFSMNQSECIKILPAWNILLYGNQPLER